MNLKVPIWEKITITPDEASALTGIGVKAIRDKCDEEGCDFVIFKGTHKLLKRKKFEKYLEGINTW